MRRRFNHIGQLLLSQYVRYRHRRIIFRGAARRMAGATGFLLLLLLSMNFTASAQFDIDAMEYYIDTDPGFGNATPIAITPGAIVDIPNQIIPAAALANGHHTLGIRARNTNGDWGFTEKRPFYILSGITPTTPVPADINAMEYYIDDDPGMGNATPITITTGSVVDIPNLIIPAAALTPGFHTLGIRGKNTDGDWGFAEKRPFYISPPVTLVPPPPADIQTLEYFFDTDPGIGNATQITVTQGQLIDINELIPENLSPGHHHIHIRAKNIDGDWGMAESRPVYIRPPTPTVAPPADITQIEYYFDGADPGVGNGIDLPITPGQIIDLAAVNVPTSPTLVDGEHYITFRAMNADNVWGMAQMDTFNILDDCTQPIAAFTPHLGCAGQPVIFADSSKNLQVDARYRWYLNGDNLVDDTTTGDVTFTYANPGTYVVALAIRQGTICLDSVATTIEILPQPVAVFTASNTVLLQRTDFTPSATNIPAGAIWAWDFDGDGIIDDTTAGPTTYVYNAIGTYDVSLTIAEPLGCGITVTNTITITETGGSAPPPTVDFLADNTCTNSSLSFIDLSQNIPAGSTYNWDFDGDGITDSTTPGSQTFTYTASGTYAAKLVIDLGGSTIETTKNIEVVDVPVVDFDAPDVCDGSPMTFTDLSTNTEATAVYMWDFDNDGIIDSNAKVNVTHTFPAPGSYIVSLKISNNYGCEAAIVKQVNVITLPSPDFSWDRVCTGEIINFNDLSTGIDPAATYSWDIDGDGTEDFNTKGDVAYTFASLGSYNPTLTITNPAGCAVMVSKPLEIFDRPEVVFDVVAQCYGQESMMVDLSQKVSPTATYSWDFNNDGIEDDNTVGSTAFTYNAYSTYVVNLTINNGGGCLSSAQNPVIFADAATPDFTVNKLCEGEPVVFTDLSTGLNTGAIYSWDFNGDGFEDAAIPGSTAYTYPQAGTYDATLTIDNGGNCLAYKTLTIDITPPPAVDLGEDVNLCEEGTVTLDAGAGYAAYLWPDGSTNQTYTVNQVGTYMVKVQDIKGCSNTDTVAVQLLGPPVPSFEHHIELSLEGIRVIFTNTSTNATAYVWDFGDGTNSVEENPSHVFSEFSFYETSVYTICLQATNDCETAEFCEDVFVSPTQVLQEGGEAIQVYPNPAGQYVYVELGPDTTGKKLVLVNMEGQTVWFKKELSSRHEIDLSQLSQGMYYFILEQGNGFLYKKLMKN